MQNLYITDLDKTLLKTDLTISKFTENIWNQLCDNGIKLTIATARSGVKSLKLLKNLQLHHPMIVMDGAMIISREGEILRSYALGFDDANIVLELGKQYQIDPFFIGIDERGTERFIHSTNLNNLQKELLIEYKNDKRIQQQTRLKPLTENIKIVYIGDHLPLSILKDDLVAQFGDKIEIKFSKDPYIDGYFLTILHPKGDKAHALEALQEMETFKPLSLTVFGDSHNDIGMFHKADTKIAVSNALDEVKDIATHILPHSNDEDGVARYLNQKYATLLS
ncbi:MAG: HAD family hydrolase [Epsilonproteobacteria bacterium]|nr:HAD family hydrolase [Campylobacterota bacterium]